MANCRNERLGIDRSSLSFRSSATAWDSAIFGDFRKYSIFAYRRFPNFRAGGIFPLHTRRILNINETNYFINFSYVCYENGGGAFLIAYFTTIFAVGLPAFFLELTIGK